MNNCPCGSGNLYSACCEPIITDARVATTAEELMRARYAAHVAVQVDFIFDSTHPDHRQEFDRATTEKWSKDADWLGLEILATTKGGADDNSGEVEFTARFREEKELRLHHELAQFEKKDGRWYFTDGSLVRPKPLVANKTGRNDPCPCGSGNKYKKCCGK